MNFHTVRGAYGELESEGLLVCEQGRGTFVAAGARALTSADLRRLVRAHVERLAEDIANAQVDPDTLAALVDDELRRATGARKAAR